ncbi:fatty acid desaturase family protein [Calycomorphotria hydatis]|uniref:Fatty acid desaturase n=1 Tax=Calycomorphotria hydatis TaxID=2528027 RepID=A0A517TB46_9PLAN|nr:fatty acid desaturase [Calycomorphotria hydatis]QDT65590.1 Fatty acid desaturase [Calycomorphotria hydatis]
MSRTTFTAEQTKEYAEKHSLLRLAHIPLGLPVMIWLATDYPMEYPLWWALATLFMGYVYFCYTSCFHETAHQTLTGKAWFDIAFGKFIGTMALVPYTCYRECHIRHHAYLNRPEDWELWPYSDPKTSRTFRTFFAWVEVLLGIVGPPVVYGRIYWHKDSPLKEDGKRAVRNEYLLMVAFWASVLGLVAVTNTWGIFLRVWAIPYIFAGFYQTMRRMTEHLGMASYDPMLGTRTVVGKNWFTRMCTFINFDIFVHGPHHRHPKVSHDKLKRQMETYLEHNPDTDFPVFRTYTAAIFHMLPALLNPGVGMNAGAEAPGKSKLKVRDFVTDVTEEILNEKDVVITK